MKADNSGEVLLMSTSDRDLGIKTLLEHFDLSDFNQKQVALKGNYNSADTFPASTHIDTLEAIIRKLNEEGVDEVIVAERSGMGNTRRVLEEMGVLTLSQKMGFKAVVLDEEDAEGWAKIPRKGTHWVKGFYISKIFEESDKVVQTCCLKTHRFGGHFTLSLKNSVGLVAKTVPGGLYNYMAELHISPYQRLMIAEINKYYNVDLVVMDAIKAFIKGGPERGKLVEPNLLLASKDRVALDAVGVAILRYHGAKVNSKKSIFELEQINRAAELGIGVKSAAEINLIPLNEASQTFADRIVDILKN